MRLVLTATLGVLLVACSRSQPQTGATPAGGDAQGTVVTENGVSWITPYGRPVATRPFTPAVRVGNMLYLSGQIGTAANAQGAVVPGGIQAETRQTMQNIKDAITILSDLDKLTVHSRRDGGVLRSSVHFKTR